MSFTTQQQIRLLKISFYAEDQTEYATRHFEHFIEKARDDPTVLELLNKVIHTGYITYDSTDEEFYSSDDCEVLDEGSL